MDTGLNIRPVQPVSIAPVRMSPPVERQTAVSELPDVQAVTALSKDPAADRRDDDRTGTLRAEISTALDRRARTLGQTLNKVDRDEATKELIFRKISAETGQVVGQFPDEALLRQKAYTAQMEKRAEAEADAGRTA
jgi:hypothetical protein